MHWFDWVGMALGALGAWPAGSKLAKWRRIGFIVWIVSDLFWVLFGLAIHSLPLVVLNLLFILTSARGALNANKAL
jgi:hypothetical protein